jgi:hypothetical protein
MAAAAAGISIGFDRDVTELAGHAVHAVPDFSSEHDAATDSGAESDDSHVGDAAGSAEPLLAEGGDVGVVFEDDGGAQTALDFIAHGILFKAREVGGLAEHSGLHVNDAGDADAGAEKFSGFLILGGEALDGVAHFGDDVVTAESDFGAEGNFFEKLAVSADGGDAEIGAAEVDSDGKIGHG